MLLNSEKRQETYVECSTQGEGGCNSGTLFQTNKNYVHIGCIRLGNPDLDFENYLDFGFCNRMWIQKLISPQLISIKKSKSRFNGFPFYCSMVKSEKRICKTLLVNSGLPFAYYECTCKTAVYIKDSFSHPFLDFLNEW